MGTMPRLAVKPAHSEVDRTIIRIHSEHQWPTAVAIDTNVKPINSPIRDDFPSSPVDPNRSQDGRQDTRPGNVRRNPSLPATTGVILAGERFHHSLCSTGEIESAHSLLSGACRELAAPQAGTQRALV
jgi:hypothetical protein